MSSKKKTKKAKRVRSDKRYYGLTKVKTGQKLAWLSHENKHGFSLGLALNNRTVWLRNLRFATKKEVQNAVGGTVVFTELKK